MSQSLDFCGWFWNSRWTNWIISYFESGADLWWKFKSGPFSTRAYNTNSKCFGHLSEPKSTKCFLKHLKKGSNHANHYNVVWSQIFGIQILQFLIKIIVSVHEMKCSIDFRHSTYSIEQIQERNLHQMQV